MAEVTEITEPLADRIEEVAEVTRGLTGRDTGFFVGGAAVGVAIGFGVAYFFADKRLKTKYEKIAEQEIDDMREHFRKKLISLEGQEQRRRPLEHLIVERGYTEGGKSQFTEAELEAIAKANADNPPEDESQQNLRVNVFEQQEWNYEVELSGRQSGVPYIIHLDEFQENEPEHEQITLTYYEEDDILADVRDEVIRDMDAAIGLGNLGRWGHGSKDPNVVYVRNEELRLDYEICRDRGSYASTSSGTIRHSSNRRRQSIRPQFDD